MKAIYKLFRASYFMAYIKGILKYGKFGNDRFFDIKKTDDRGLGIFSTISRRKGSLVFIATGPTKHAHFEGEHCFDFPDWYSVDKDTWIDMNLPYIKINHSCDPNTAIDGYRCFRALRDIQKDEELTFDYAITDEETDWGFTCLCGSQDCTGWVGPIQTISDIRYKKSYPYIPKYFQCMYEKQKTLP